MLPLQKSTAQEMLLPLEDTTTVIPLSPPPPWEDGCKPKFIFRSIKP
jgi:hypothetical protein